jgi:hypothetical protein
MNQPSQGPIYGELHSMSFIQLFHLCVAITSWNWVRNRDLSLVVGRAQDYCVRRRSQQPAYAAMLLHENGIAPGEPCTDGESRIGSCITAW